MFRNNNKVFTASPSSGGFAATFSPMAKALTAVPLFIRAAFLRVLPQRCFDCTSFRST